jgi:2-dehydro-3-deoxyphosphogluconate aldolase / (4S)-4-hydroxy-2-oxoglutarate aldolase
MERGEGLELLEKTRIMAIVSGVERDRVIPLTEALYEGGIRSLEVALHSVGAFYMIKDLKKHFGKKLFIGAGTVLDVKDAQTAVEAGASFFSAPNADKRVIQYGTEDHIPVYAGALTPTEVVKAWKAGAEAVRLFPVSTFGPAYVRELKDTLGHIPLLAAGGIHEGNAADYLRAGCKGIGMDAAQLYHQELPAGDYQAIRSRAAGLTAAVQAALGDAAFG